MKEFRFTTILFLIVLSLWGCTPSFLYVSDPTVYVREKIPPQETTSKLTVLPFESPSYYPEIGMYTAKVFFQRLLEKEEFKVSFSQGTDWYKRGKSWIRKTELAVEEGRKLKSDYILIGSVDYYLVGHITSNKVIVTARLIEVKTGEIIYFATGYGSGKPGKTFLALDLKAGEKTPSTTSVLYAVVDHLVKDFFDNKNGLLRPLNIIL
jgi:TolB-like protein